MKSKVCVVGEVERERYIYKYIWYRGARLGQRRFIMKRGELMRETLGLTS